CFAFVPNVATQPSGCLGLAESFKWYTFAQQLIRRFARADYYACCNTEPRPLRGRPARPHRLKRRGKPSTIGCARALVGIKLIRRTHPSRTGLHRRHDTANTST